MGSLDFLRHHSVLYIHFDISDTPIMKHQHRLLHTQKQANPQ